MRRNTGRRTMEIRLADAFRELVRTKDADKGSVRDIAEEAGVIRATFYNHFSDKSELVRWIVMTEVVEPVFGLFRNGMYREAVVLIFQNLKEDEAFYKRVALMTKPVPFREIVDECVHDLIFRHMELAGAKEIDHTWLTIRMVSDLYAHIITFLVMEWMNTGMTVSPEEAAKVFEYLGTRTLWDILAAVESDPGFAEGLTEERGPRF